MKLLDGIKILSFNHYLAGPLAAQTLADLGADVIAVEPIEGAFLACTLWLADAYVLCGNLGKAQALFDRVVAVANDLGLLAEEYDPAARRQLGTQELAHRGDPVGDRFERLGPARLDDVAQWLCHGQHCLGGHRQAGYQTPGVARPGPCSSPARPGR